MVINLGHFANEVVTGPAVEPVTLAEAKTHLRVDSDDYENDYITNLIIVARQLVEKFTRRALITQTRRLTLDRFSCRTIYLDYPPLQSVSSVSYTSTDGSTVTLTEGTDYEVDIRSTPARIYPAYSKVWPTTRLIENAVTVTFIAGYGDAADDVPDPIKHAIKIMISDLYENRESVSYQSFEELPTAARYLLSCYRDYRFR